MITTLISCLTLVLLASASLALGDLLIDDFENGIDSGWAIKEFAGHSEYRPVRDGAEQVLSCRSDGTASSLYFREEASSRMAREDRVQLGKRRRQSARRG